MSGWAKCPWSLSRRQSHPLTSHGSRIPKSEAAKYVQLVLTDRSDLMAGHDYGVVSSSTWRLADLSTKYAFIKDGVGWGGMPLHMVENDIASGSLVVLDLVGMSGSALTMSAYHQPPEPPGPAGRWFIDHLRNLWERPVGRASDRSPNRPRKSCCETIDLEPRGKRAVLVGFLSLLGLNARPSQRPKGTPRPPSNCRSRP